MSKVKKSKADRRSFLRGAVAGAAALAVPQSGAAQQVQAAAKPEADPEPVAPATSMWGAFARSVMTGRPTMSLPRQIGRRPRDS